jgi:GTP-binding protein
MERLPITPRFMKGAYHLDQLPDDSGREIVIAGRSNVGKSSALNTIAGVRSLARTSKTPGRTQEINFFDLGDDRRIVDLPGYGYAKVSDTKKRHWGKALEEYLASRESLVGMVLLMDIRHPLRDFDLMMLDWCRHTQMPVYVMLTKADKLSRGRAMGTLQSVRSKLKDYPLDGIQLFSSLKRTGVEEAVRQLCKWLHIPVNEPD